MVIIIVTMTTETKQGKIFVHSVYCMSKVPMKWKIICAYLKGLSKYRRMVFFFLKYLFSF